MNCLCCNEEIIIELDWANFLFPPKPSLLCNTCKRQMTLLDGNRCKRCSRVTEAKICDDCLQWETYYGGVDVLEFNFSVYTYSSFMQDMIAKWKYRGDYELGTIFEDSYSEHFHKMFAPIKDAVIIPIPLSMERLQERCFNQAVMLASFLSPQKMNILSRTHGEKQSKKSRKERIYSENPFILQQKLNNPVILVDDIYTTGTTLRHAAKLLKDAGCPKVYSYTLIRG